MNAQLRNVMELHVCVGASLLGKPVSEMPRVLQEQAHAHQVQVTAALAKRQKGDAAGAAVSQVARNGTRCFESMSAIGFINGDTRASINCPTVMKCSASGGSGSQAIAVGGGLLWSMIPSGGKRMDPPLGAGGWGAGKVQVYWSSDATVVGELIVAVGGAAISGISGSGKWPKS